MRKFRLSKRRLTYYAIKLAKQSGTPECIAKAMSLGLFIGFFIPMGLQIIVVLPLALLFKANKIVSCLGTMVTNHFTVPFIYPFQCVLGSYIIAKPLTYAKVYQPLMNAINSPTWKEKFHELWLLGEDIVVPFFVGGTLLAVLFSVPGYFISLYLVRAVRNRKQQRQQLRLKKSQLSPE